MLIPLSARQDLQANADTKRQLDEIGEALIGFAASHAVADGKPYLPCPNTNGDGAEGSRTSGACDAQEGTIPWQTLGVGREDAWANRFRYRVSPAFSNSASGFALASVGTLRVCDAAACTGLLASSLPAVVVAHGKNGYGAINASGGTNPTPPGNDEKANQDGNNDFVSHAGSPGGSANEFDDLVAWISPNVLFNRMISAGRLP